MQYVSTRGDAPVLEFTDALLTGLAPDGGLYMPTRWPTITAADLHDFADLPYAEVAARVLAPFCEPSIDFDTLRHLTDDAYSTFRHDEVVPVSQLTADATSASLDQGTGGEYLTGEYLTGEYLVELFWGPTFSFKDVALQLLGRLFEHELTRRGETITIVGATSGDTGSAAIEACRDRSGIRLVMLHPAGRITETQRRQMTTVDAPNIHNVAVAGTFDDCQDMVKAMFGDPTFRQQTRLAAVNSINWARVAAQTVYYATTAVKLGAPLRSVSLCVPTGNFGNILAGDIARRMGVPIERLIIASNHNDILTRTYETGTMRLKPVMASSSPAMDIAVSSNFERLVFELGGRVGHVVAAALAELRSGTDGMVLDPEVVEALRAGFEAGRATDTEVAATIAQVLEQSGRLIDPHTAVAVSVARRLRANQSVGAANGQGVPLAIMSTAHPAKFAEAVTAATGQAPEMPPELAMLAGLDERCVQIDNDLAAAREIVAVVAAG